MSFFSFFSKSKIANQLAASSSKISTTITQIFTHKKLDNLTAEELEETLILADLGVDVSAEIIKKFREKKFEKNLKFRFFEKICRFKKFQT